MDNITPPPLRPTSKPKQNVATVAVISLMVGGLAGGVVGAITGGTVSHNISPWIDRVILGEKTTNTATPTSVGSTTTLKVQEESQTETAVAKVLPSVGSIVVKQNVSNNSPFFFFGPQGSGSTSPQQVAAGTGFIVSKNGYILTNKHVVSVSDAQFTFITNDGKEYSATLVGTDPMNDLAIMKIEAANLTPVELGDLSSVQLGQTVIAIGNTLSEFPNTVTKGIVSGIGRTITAGSGTGQSETIDKVIQTDAAINPGNSGGPLINLAGQVIGINTAVSQEGQLIGFAIPISTAKPVIQSVEQSGKIVRPYLGIRYQVVTPELAKTDKLSVDYGALIIRASASEPAVVAGSPAEKAGLVENDIILEINGQKINEDNSLASMMQSFSVGETITLKVSHAGTEKTVTAVLQEYPTPTINS